MTPIVDARPRIRIIPGTWAVKNAAKRERDGLGPAYWQARGSLVRDFADAGWTVVRAGDPGWDTKLAGTLAHRLIWQRYYQDAWLRSWRAGGADLLEELRLDPEPGRLVLLGHSHAINPIVIALAAESCPPIWGLCTVGSPNRADMQTTMAAARLKIRGPWLHLQMGRKDRWHWFGTIGSGQWQDTVGGMLGLTAGPAYADRRDRLTDYDHNDILELPSLYHLWNERRAYLTPPPARVRSAGVVSS